MVPRGFVLGRSLLAEFTSIARRDAPPSVPPKLPAFLLKEIAAGLPELGLPCAIRRSPLDDSKGSGEWQAISGGRPERETYLHLTDAAEVHEAVRRIWGAGLAGTAPASLAVVVQRFILPEVCAVVRHDPGDSTLLHVQSTLGIGDLLAAGLVVPDRHTIRDRDGSIIRSSLGRKAQMSVPRPDGGLVRVPVPASAARRLALDEDKLAALAATWRQAEASLGPLAQLALSFSSGRWYVTSAVEAPKVGEEEIMLG